MQRSRKNSTTQTKGRRCNGADSSNSNAICLYCLESNIQKCEPNLKKFCEDSGSVLWRIHLA